MLIQFQPQYLTILEFKLVLDFSFGRRPLVFAIEMWVVFVDNAVEVGTDDNDVGGVVVLRLVPSL